MKRLSIALGVAMVASLFVAVPTLAWHVDTGDCASTPEARIIEPSGDPWGRIVVSHDIPCQGWVRVPDADWVDGGTFYIAGYELKRGERAFLSPGNYSGTWSNSSEVEKVVIRDTAGPVLIVWRGVGKNGVFKQKTRLPNDCVYRSSWKWLEGSTWTWVQDRTNKTRLATKKVAPPGFYGPLYKGFDKGIECPISIA